MNKDEELVENIQRILDSDEEKSTELMGENAKVQESDDFSYFMHYVEKKELQLNRLTDEEFINKVNEDNEEEN